MGRGWLNSGYTLFCITQTFLLKSAAYTSMKCCIDKCGKIAKSYFYQDEIYYLCDQHALNWHTKYPDKPLQPLTRKEVLDLMKRNKKVNRG